MKSKRQKHAHTRTLTNTLTYTGKENHKNAANDFSIVAAADVVFVVAAVSVAAYVKGLPKITATKEAQLTGLGYGSKKERGKNSW